MSIYKSPFFSIVIVNYNHGRFLSEALDSIINQSCKDYEIIMVDGGSNDNSLEIIEKYSNYFSWWVSEKDNGQSDAFNKGFSHAKGDVYFWLNADDLLLPNTLEKAKAYFTKHINCYWLAGNTITMNQNREIQWCIRGPKFVDFLVKKGDVYVYGPTSFFKKELFNEAEGFDINLHYTMDTDLWYRFINAGYRFERLNHFCWGLRIHTESKTSHAFSGEPSPVFLKEQEYIKIKNSHEIFPFTKYLLIIWKLLSMTYIVRFINNVKLKGKKL